MRLRSRLLTLTLALAMLAAAAVGTASAATLRHVEGRVVSVDRGASTFQLRDSQRGTFTVRVTSSTKFQRLSFSSLRAGRSIEATIRRANGAWQATKVEPNAGSHTQTGDDHGRSRGSDDGAGHR